MSNETIMGTFYEVELSKYNDDIYEIEKVLKSSKNKVLVKWKGYDSPSWINKKNIINNQSAVKYPKKLRWKTHNRLSQPQAIETRLVRQLTMRQP